MYRLLKLADTEEIRKYISSNKINGLTDKQITEEYQHWEAPPQPKLLAS
jgi:hypothetical protein